MGPRTMPSADEYGFHAVPSKRAGPSYVPAQTSPFGAHASGVDCVYRQRGEPFSTISRRTARCTGRSDPGIAVRAMASCLVYIPGLTSNGVPSSSLYAVHDDPSNRAIPYVAATICRRWGRFFQSMMPLFFHSASVY